MTKKFNPYFRQNARYVRSLLVATRRSNMLFEGQLKPPPMMNTSKITLLMSIH